MPPIIRLLENNYMEMAIDKIVPTCSNAMLSDMNASNILVVRN